METLWWGLQACLRYDDDNDNGCGDGGGGGGGGASVLHQVRSVCEPAVERGTICRTPAFDPLPVITGRVLSQFSQFRNVDHHLLRPLRQARTKPKHPPSFRPRAETSFHFWNRKTAGNFARGRQQLLQARGAVGRERQQHPIPEVGRRWERSFAAVQGARIRHRHRQQRHRRRGKPAAGGAGHVDRRGWVRRLRPTGY